VYSQVKILTSSAKSFLSVVVLFMAVGCGVARADVIFNSLDENTAAGYFPIGSDLPDFGSLGASFLTGASASTLTSVSVFLYECCQPLAGSFSISLFSNSASNNPGTLLETLATPPDSILPSITYGAFTYSGLSYLLDANTEYWIKLSSTSATMPGPGWVVTNNGGIGVSGQYFYYDGGSNPGTFPNGQGNCVGCYAMQMTIDTTPVPEPSLLFPCGFGLLAGVTVIARRRVGRIVDHLISRVS
jgi:hypothetical protein